MNQDCPAPRQATDAYTVSHSIAAFEASRNLADIARALRAENDHWRLVARECCDAIRDQDDIGALRMLEVALNGG